MCVHHGGDSLPHGTWWCVTVSAWPVAVGTVCALAERACGVWLRRREVGSGERWSEDGRLRDGRTKRGPTGFQSRPPPGRYLPYVISPQSAELKLLALAGPSDNHMRCHHVFKVNRGIELR